MRQEEYDKELIGYRVWVLADTRNLYWKYKVPDELKRDIDMKFS